MPVLQRIMRMMCMIFSLPHLTTLRRLLSIRMSIVYSTRVRRLLQNYQYGQTVLTVTLYLATIPQLLADRYHPKARSHRDTPPITVDEIVYLL